MSQRTEDAFDFSDDISKKQDDRITTMIDRALDKSQMICVGEKRHDAKEAAKNGGAHGSHELMQNTGMFSWNTVHKYKSDIHTFATYCKVNYNTNDLTGIKPNMITTFFEEMSNRGYSQNTFEAYCSAIEKFAVVFDKAYPDCSNRMETWHNAVMEAKEDLKGSFVELDKTTRAYNDPQAMITSLQDDACKMVGMLQLNHGLRLSDACKLQEIKDLGMVAHSKGGQAIKGIYEKLSPEEKTLLNSLNPKDFEGLKDRYQYQLEKSANACGEEYNGTHGLRHNFARDTYNDYISQGYSHKDALLATAEEMGHHRPDVTETYLR